MSESSGSGVMCSCLPWPGEGLPELIGRRCPRCGRSRESDRSDVMTGPRYVCPCGDPDCDAIPYTDDRERTCPHCGGQGCGECAHTGAVPLASGLYFSSADEANEWLEFDSDDEERERAAYATPDRFEEWRCWRASDITALAPPLGPTGAGRPQLTSDITALPSGLPEAQQRAGGTECTEPDNSPHSQQPR